MSSPEPFAPSITGSSATTAASSATHPQRRLSLRLANKLSSPVTDKVDECAYERKLGSVTSCCSDFGEVMCTQLLSGSGISKRRLRSGSDHIEKDRDVAASFKGSGSGYGVEETGKMMCGKDPLKPHPSSEPFTPCIAVSRPNTSMDATPVACITNSRCRVTQRQPCDIKLPVSVTADEATANRERFFRVSRRKLRTDSCDNNKNVKMMMIGDGAEEKLKIMSEDEQGSNTVNSSPKNEAVTAEILVRDSGWHMEEEDKKGKVHYSAQVERCYMSLRSGSRVPKRKIVDDGVNFLLDKKELDVFSSRVKTMEEIVTENGGCQGKENNEHDEFFSVEDQLGKGTNSAFIGSNVVELLVSRPENLAIQDEGKLVLQNDMVGATEVDLNVVPIPKGLHEEMLIDDGLMRKKRSKRYNKKEKGKEKLSSIDFKVTEGEQITKEEEFNERIGSREHKSGDSQENANYRREAAKKLAIELAHEFAFFKTEEEETVEEVESDDSIPDAKEEEHEWFGPFSTALKIVEERESMLRARNLNISSQNEKAEVKIPWTPSIHKTTSFRILAPSLKDLCLKVLCDNVEGVESLEGLPDAFKHNIAFRLCHSRRMSSHVLCLLTEGSPIDIYLSDCSWATQEQFEEIFSQCNLDSLKVLQLDFCGRCLTDSVLHSTLAKAPNCLPSLNELCLKGAYCLSDSGLDAIISSAPLLKSLNLSQCSLITSNGIISLAEKLGPILQELYIDACNNVDVMLILPALKKLKCLEVLSIAHMQTVTDKFLKSLIPVSGPKMRGLTIAGCSKLTNASLKTIGENCHHLSFLDIRSLNRLSDSTLEHLANGGCPFQTLKFCHGAFSDEALAALLEASGATLIELVLNKVEKAAGNTALAISRQCSTSLRRLDLSFCRNMTDEALGLIVDSCSNLRILKLFGCTQVTDVFLEGHSNLNVKIIGLKGSILDEVWVPAFV